MYEGRFVFGYIGRTRPSFVACVLRTRNSTRVMPMNGTSPATMMIVSTECVAAIGLHRRSNRLILMQ